MLIVFFFARDGSRIFVAKETKQATTAWCFNRSDQSPLLFRVYGIHVIILPVHSYVGTMKSHYKNPYKPTSTMACHKNFEHCLRHH